MNKTRYRWLGDVEVPKGYSLHHIIPRSRGGSNDEKNILIVLKKLHRLWHELYANFTPYEAKFINLAWRTKDSNLNKNLLGTKKLRAYLAIFGDVTPDQANQIISRDWQNSNVDRFRKNKRF